MTLAKHIDQLARRASGGRLRMQLLTAADLRALPPVKSQDGKGFVATAHVKFFGGGRWTWYVTEASALVGTDNHGCGREVPLADVEDVSKVDDVQFFGWIVSGLGADCDEFCYFRLSELAEMQFPPFGLAVERDRHFDPVELRSIPEIEANTFTGPNVWGDPTVADEPGDAGPLDLERGKHETDAANEEVAH